MFFPGIIGGNLYIKTPIRFNYESKNALIQTWAVVFHASLLNHFAGLS